MSLIDTDFEFQLPKNQSSQIKVMGVGGGGSNAVNYMFEHGIKGVDFVICNTDLQALEASPIPIKIQLGENLTEGLGAGSDPDVGMKAAHESADRISELLDANTKMLFITAGMGGGTGTGAAPVIAEIAREKGILTIAVVTHPFSNEGGYRKKYAKEGLEELKKQVDTLLIINNDKLIEIYGDLTLTQAFGKANEVLNTATKGIAEVISQHLKVNIDLNDARKVLANSGTAVMGQAEATGENRAIEAVNDALDSPLLNDNDIKMSELSTIKSKIQQAAGRDVNIIEGIGFDADLGSAVSVTVIATGFETKKVNEPRTIKLEESNLVNDNIELDLVNDKRDEISVNQQTLSLDDSFEFVNTKSKMTSVVNEEDNSLKTVLTLEDEGAVIHVEDENSNIFIEEVNDNINDPNNFIADLVEDLAKENLNESINDNEEKINSDVDIISGNQNMRIEAREREDRLRDISIKLRTPSGLTRLEDEPAFKRNNINLEDTMHSSEDNVSHYTLTETDSDKLILKDNNPYLHDNVD
jgi:cell division protein FtsZ